MGGLVPNRLRGPDSKLISLCYDDPEVTPEDKVRHDACLVVADDVKVEAPVAKKTIPPGRYAMTLHKGPYMDLSQTYALLCGQWIPQNGHEIDARPSLQIYLNNYLETASEDLLTEVFVPLK